MKKTIITSFLLGILVAIFTFHAYTVYSIRKDVATLNAVMAKHENDLYSEGGIVQYLKFISQGEPLGSAKTTTTNQVK